MPTGYTAPVQEGKLTELRHFVLQCARAFGALIEMRDSAMDVPIPKRFKPNTKYHDEKLREAQKTIKRLASMSPEDCDNAAEKEYLAALKYWQERGAKRTLHRSRYEGMLEKVKAWKPPQGNASLKSFMIQQLSESIEWDCSSSQDDKPVRRSGEDWHNQQSKSAAYDIEYHSKERANEIHRVEERNLWLEALRASLPAE